MESCGPRVGGRCWGRRRWGWHYRRAARARALQALGSATLSRVSPLPNCRRGEDGVGFLGVDRAGPSLAALALQVLLPTELGQGLGRGAASPSQLDLAAQGLGRPGQDAIGPRQLGLAGQRLGRSGAAWNSWAASAQLLCEALLRSHWRSRHVRSAKHCRSPLGGHPATRQRPDPGTEARWEVTLRRGNGQTVRNASGRSPRDAGLGRHGGHTMRKFLADASFITFQGLPSPTPERKPVQTCSNRFPLSH